MTTATDSLPGPIREAFLADHRRLEALVDQLLVAFEADDREAIAKLWTQVESGLLAHFEAEETHLIPELLRRSDRGARVIIGEHQHLRARLAELGVGVDLHLVRLEAARHFVDELRAHARNEDRLLYSWADDQLDDDAQLATIGALRGRAPAVRASS
jgi:hemerythrin superfamily protein